jgi:hypothetical protein
MMRFPDFFIVGAPKCGTSTLHDWLGQHPQLYLPSARENAKDYWLIKEPNYYCGDLGIAHRRRIIDKERYLRLFDAASSGQLLGDASPAYLYSEDAVNRIFTDKPNAKIIIQIRNPAEFIRSLHFSLIRTDKERKFSLEKAIKSGSKGKVPKNAGEPHLYDYLEKARFYPYVKMYFDRFGSENVRVLLLEETKDNPLEALAKIYNFLGIDYFEPSLSVRNVGSYTLDDHQVGGVVTNKIPGYNLISSLVPEQAKKLGRNIIEKHILGSRQMGPISDSLRQKILMDTCQSTVKLSKLTGLNLSNWLPRENQAILWQ